MEKFNKSKVSRLTGDTVVIFSNPTDTFRVTATPTGLELEGKMEFATLSDMEGLTHAIGSAWGEWDKIRKKIITLESMKVTADQVLK